MMWIIILSIATFVCLIVFELEKVKCYRHNINRKNPFFIIGCILLLGTWIYVIIRYWNSGPLWGIALWVRVLAGAIVTIAGLVFYSYILFFALPKEIYQETSRQQLIDSGIYGICRHPGVYGFIITALGLAVLAGSCQGTAIAIAYSIFNLVYVYLQDRYFFPVYLEGYDSYKERVPFLVGRKKH